LSPILERLAESYGGRFVLARIDVDANQALAEQFGVQGIPAVFAVVAGQLVPLFQGALPEAQVRQYLDQLLTLAQQQFGMTGPPAEGEEAEAGVPEPPHDPAFDAAYTALDNGDVDGAARAFQNVLASEPANADAQAGLAQVELLQRTRGADPAAVRAAAADGPDDVVAQLAAADLDMLGGHVEDAVSRLVAFVARAAGDEREQARVRLLDYFAMLGPDDERVVGGRAALMRVLF
jgi:putative thioredoxin